ncbi:CPBP family glutamic-type intramembrane protease [Clostridium pasteurianum]
MYILIMNAVVVFVEEVIYRGYLQTRLICWLGTIIYKVINKVKGI